MLVAGYRAACLDALPVALSTGTILIEKQLGGARLAHGIKHLPEGVAAIEEEQQYGDVGFSGILHFDTFSLQRYNFWHGLHGFTRIFYIFAAK